MKFGDDANALVSRFFKLFEVTLENISKFPDSQIFSDVIQKPIWQQYVEFFSDIPEDFKGLWTKQLQMISSCKYCPIPFSLAKTNIFYSPPLVR